MHNHIKVLVRIEKGAFKLYLNLLKSPGSLQNPQSKEDGYKQESVRSIEDRSINKSII